MLDDADTTEIHPLFAGAPQGTEFRKLRKRLVQNVREATQTYGMIEPGARWLVCLSGGKDSYTLLAILHELKWRGLLPVDLLACNLDQGQPGFPATVLPEFLTRMGVPHRIEYQDTYSIVMDKVPQGRTYCSLCSRLRRGNLYRIAREEGCDALVAEEEDELRLPGNLPPQCARICPARFSNSFDTGENTDDTATDLIPFAAICAAIPRNSASSNGEITRPSNSLPPCARYQWLPRTARRSSGQSTIGGRLADSDGTSRITSTSRMTSTSRTTSTGAARTTSSREGIPWAPHIQNAPASS